MKIPSEINQSEPGLSGLTYLFNEFRIAWWNKKALHVCKVTLWKEIQIPMANVECSKSNSRQLDVWHASL